MKYTIEKLENSLIKVSYEASAEDWHNAIEKSYNKNRGRYRVDGFRAGKAPKKKIESIYGPNVFWDDAVNFLIDDYYRKSKEAEGFKSYCEPDFKITAITDSELKFEAKVQGKPEVKLGKYTGIKIERMDKDVKIDEVDAEIKKAAERVATWEAPAKKRACKNGDKVTIDFVGSIDGVEFAGGAAEGHELPLGSGQFIPGFEDQVCGMKIGDKKDVKVPFPADYQAEELAGKDAVFAVTLHEIKEKKMPELNDELAKDISEFDTLDEYKADVTAKLTQRREKEADFKAVDDLLSAIIKNAKAEIPKQMTEERAEHMVEEYLENMARQGIKPEMYFQYTGTTAEEMKKQHLPKAEEACKASLVFEEIMEKEDLKGDGGEKLLEWLKEKNGLGDIKGDVVE